MQSALYSLRVWDEHFDPLHLHPLVWGAIPVIISVRCNPQSWTKPPKQVS